MIPVLKRRVRHVRRPPHLHSVDLETIRRVKGRMKPEETMILLADTFSVLGDPGRAKMLYALVQAELCVCDLAAIVGMSESAVSHQLRWLRALGLVTNRREGRQVYYSLADGHVRGLLKLGIKHVEERL